MRAAWPLQVLKMTKALDADEVLPVVQLSFAAQTMLCRAGQAQAPGQALFNGAGAVTRLGLGLLGAYGSSSDSEASG